MSEKSTADSPATDAPRSVHQLLLQMDLATEILEGLDELGLDTRAQVEELLARLEREIADAS